MIELPDIRKHFGLSQPNIAQLLNTSTSTIKMVEMGQRKLPLLSAAPFARVLQYFMNAARRVEEEKVDNNNVEQVAIVGELNSYILATEPVVKRLEGQLSAMQTAYRQALNRKGLLQFLKTEVPSSETDNPWFNLLLNSTQQAIKINGAGPQAMLQWKLDINKYGLQKALELEQQLVTGAV